MGKNIRRCLEKFDYFGVQHNFTYGSKEKYTTVFGGVGFLIFLAIGVAYSFLNLFPLIKRENLSMVYYSMQLSHTDSINFHYYHNNIAVGVSSCPLINDNLTKFWDYFKVEMLHKERRTANETTEKITTQIPIGKCEFSDFNDEFDDYFKTLDLGSYYCMKNTNFTIHGTYTSDVFKYITVVLKAKDDKKETFQKISQILEDECDFSMYFVDSAIDIFNYTTPIQRFLFSQFLNIKYSQLIKKNSYFQLQKFKSYENYFFDSYKQQTVIGVGGVELYSVLKRKDEVDFKVEDYDAFAKIYVRPELKRKIIERRYMKLTEFGANISSMLSAVLIVMFVLVSFINKFYANETVMRKIFQFNPEKGCFERNRNKCQKKKISSQFIMLLQRFNFDEDILKDKDK